MPTLGAAFILAIIAGRNIGVAACFITDRGPAVASIRAAGALNTEAIVLCEYTEFELSMEVEAS